MAKLLEYLNIDGKKFTKNDIRRLDLLIESYPYFNTLYIIKLIILFKFNRSDFKKEFIKVHIRIQDIKHFYKIISPLRYEYEYKELHKLALSSKKINKAKIEEQNKDRSLQKKDSENNVEQPVVPDVKLEEESLENRIIQKYKNEKLEEIKPVTGISAEEPINKKKAETTEDEKKASKEVTKEFLSSEFDETSIKEIVNKQVEKLKKLKQQKKPKKIIEPEKEEIISDNEMNEEDMISSILEQVDKIKKSKEQLKKSEEVEKQVKEEKSATNLIDKQIDKDNLENKQEKPLLKNEETKLIEKEEDKPIESLAEFIQKREINAGEIEKTEDGKIRYRTKYKISEGEEKNPKKAIEFLQEMAEEHRKSYEKNHKHTEEFSEKLEDEKRKLQDFPLKFKFKVVKFTHKTLKQTLLGFFDKENIQLKEITVEPTTSQIVKPEEKKAKANKEIKKKETKEEFKPEKESIKEASKEKTIEEPMSVADKILQKVAKRKQSKEGTKKQEDTIERFIKEEPRMDRNKPIKEGDISVPSIEEDDSIVTPTLAQVYLNQKLYKKALDTYEKLSLKYPEKSIYFAAQIEKIKKLINEQK